MIIVHTFVDRTLCSSYPVFQPFFFKDTLVCLFKNGDVFFRVKAQNICGRGWPWGINAYPVVVEQLQLLAQSISHLTSFEQPRVSRICLKHSKVLAVNESRAHKKPFLYFLQGLGQPVLGGFSSNSISRHVSISPQKANPTFPKTLIARRLAVRTVNTTFSHPASSAAFLMIAERAVPMPKFRNPFWMKIKYSGQKGEPERSKAL